MVICRVLLKITERANLNIIQRKVEIHINFVCSEVKVGRRNVRNDMRNKFFRLAEILLLVCVIVCGAIFFASCKKNNDSESNSSESVNDSVIVSLVSENYEKTKINCKVGAELPKIEVEDKDFEGYWTDSTYSKKYENTTVPSENVTLYYKLVYQTYSLELDFGEAGSYSYAARRGVNETLPSVSPSGTSLIGYSETKGGDPKYVVADAEKNKVINLAEKDGKVTLYAVYEIEDVADFVIENGVVKGYNGIKTEITLPYGASEVAAEAFKDNDKITKVTVPSVYSSIGKGAFSGCTSLETLNVPFIGGSRTSNRFLAYIFGADKYEDNTFSFAAYRMDNSLFMGDVHLETLLIPQSFKTLVITEKVEEIPEGAFYSAYSLENVTFVYPEEVKKVGNKAFMNCVYLGRDTGLGVYMKFDWLSSVETIGTNAFTAYYGNYESSVKEIYPYGENYKNYVAELIYPYPFSNLAYIPTLDNIVEIGEEGFSYCAYIQDIKFGNKLRKIGRNAFFYNMLNDELVLPDSLTEIGEQAFYANMALYKVAFGANIKTIRARAFANCMSLSQIVFGSDSVPTVENYAFCNTIDTKDAPSGSSIIYEATYDEITNVLVPASSVSDYKDVLPALSDKIVTPQPLSAPVYWFNKNGEVAAKFEFEQGGVVNVTDKNQQFISSVDYGNGSTPTYSATCGEYYPMNYEFLSEEEYNRTAEGDRYGKHKKPLYANQRILHLWHPELVDYSGKPLDLYLRVNEFKYEVNGFTYVLPMVKYAELYLSYDRYWGALDKDYIGTYYVSRNKYGAVMVGKVILGEAGTADVKWLDDPEGTYYMEFEESDDNEYFVIYYDSNFNEIKRIELIAKNKDTYSQWDDPLYDVKPEYTHFETKTTYNEGNVFCLDGIGNAEIKIGDNAYTATNVVEDKAKFGKVEDYEVMLSDISLNGVTVGNLTGKAVFGKLASNGNYLTVKVTIGSDSYEFVNVTYDDGWYTWVYAENKGVQFILPENSGDLTDDAWRYKAFTDVTLGGVIRVYILAPEGLGKAEYCYYREYNDDSELVSFGTFITEADGKTMVFGNGDNERVAKVVDNRGSFNLTDKSGNAKKFTRYVDSEDMTLALVESFYGTTLYYYTVKTDGFGNMYLFDEHDDDFNDVYIGTYDDYASFTIDGSKYYEIKFDGVKLDDKGNSTGEKKSFWVLYAFSTLRYYDGDDSDCMWYGSIAAIFENRDDKVVNVYDDFGNLVYEVTADVYGNTSYKKYSYELTSNGTFAKKEVTDATETFVVVNDGDGNISYLIATDKDGNSLFTVRPVEGASGLFVIAKDKGLIVTTASSQEVEIAIDYSKLKKLA